MISQPNSLHVVFFWSPLPCFWKLYFMLSVQCSSTRRNKRGIMFYVISFDGTFRSGTLYQIIASASSPSALVLYLCCSSTQPSSTKWEGKRLWTLTAEWRWMFPVSLWIIKPLSHMETLVVIAAKWNSKVCVSDHLRRLTARIWLCSPVLTRRRRSSQKTKTLCSLICHWIHVCL